MSLLVRCVSFLCLRNFIVSQLVILVVLFFYSPCQTSFAFSPLEVLFVFLVFFICSSPVPVSFFALVFSSLQFGFFLYLCCFVLASLNSSYRFLCLFLSCVLIPPGCCSQDLAVWLDWVHYSSNQAFSRPDFSHHPPADCPFLLFGLSHQPC